MNRDVHAGIIAIGIVLLAGLLLSAGVIQRMADGAGSFLMRLMDAWVRHE